MSVYMGVSLQNGEYYSKVTRNHRVYRLGAWSSESEASNAYLLGKSILDEYPDISRDKLVLEILKRMV